MRSYRTVVFSLVIMKVLLHVLVFTFEGYGIFRDELYYVANASHPAWGYVDHPPLSVWLLDIFTMVFGDSWRMLRLLSALVGGAAMYAILRLVRSMGGNIVSCWLAGIAFLFAPINLAYSSFYSMNVLELLFWPLAFLCLFRALRMPDSDRAWVLLGMVTGLGMMNKISMSWFAIGMIVFLLISPYRKLLLKRGPYLAGVTALILFLPFIFWNMANDMAHLEFAENALRFKYAGISQSDFMAEQFLMEHPLILVFLIASILMLFSSQTTWINRAPLVIFFVTLIILLLKGHVKANYMAPAYIGVMACGAIWMGQVKTRLHRGMLGGFVVLYIISGILLLPLAVPMLPEESYIDYSAALGITTKNQESKEEGLLPQFYADMHGWENFARTVSSAFQKVPEDQRENTVAWVNNYGEAGAIDYYRDKYPLPPVLSRHNNYFLWGKEMLETRDFTTLLIVGGSPDSHGRFLNSVEQVETITCTYCMPYENNLPVYLATNPKPGMLLKDIFEAEKNYD